MSGHQAAAAKVRLVVGRCHEQLIRARASNERSRAARELDYSRRYLSARCCSGYLEIGLGAEFGAS